MKAHTTTALDAETDDFDRRYLSGDALYGDDLDETEIAAWYQDEREAYAGLGDPVADAVARSYGRHNLNRRLGFRHLPPGRIGDALGIGASYGDELLPAAPRLDSVTILESSSVLREQELGGIALRYVDPDPTGAIPFENARFDLVTSFDVLHHIPNVSFVVSEIARVLRPGGHALIREPIVSMGDWRHPRRGLTTRERGIPKGHLERLAERHFDIVKATLYDFPLRTRLPRSDSTANLMLDEQLSRAFAWNYRYHPTSTRERLLPRGIALVLRAR